MSPSDPILFFTGIKKPGKVRQVMSKWRIWAEKAKNRAV
jgi:hypothetical protein